MPDAADGASLGFLQKLRLAPAEQGDERGAVESVPRLERLLRCRPCESVPRARELAVIAPVDAIAHGTAQLDRDCALELDREVGDAAPCVQPVGRDDGAGGAGRDAGAAAAAVSGACGVDGQLQIHVDLAQKEIRARVALDQIRVFADPAQARVACERLLQHGRAVDEGPITEWTDRRGDLVAESLQPKAHELVVIASQRVARYVSGAPIGEHILRIGGRGRPIVHARAEAAHRAGNEFCGP